MTKFNAAQAVDPLDYDFRPYADAHGTVPEPSDEAVRKFYVGLQHALKNALGEDRVQGVNLRDPEQFAELMSKLTEDDLKGMQDTMLELHADVLNGQPSYDDMNKLPYRLKQAWFGAVQGWLRPEASTPAMNV